MEYLRQNKKQKIIKEAAEDLQFCFVWICTVDQSINRTFKKKTTNIRFVLFESCGNASNQATSQSWRTLVKTITDTLMSQDTFGAKRELNFYRLQWP